MTNSIPQGQVEVVTDHAAVFILGPVGKEGERTILQQSSIFRLNFTRCTVTRLVVGVGLEVVQLDGPFTGVKWDSSPVKSIEEC